MIVQHAHEAHSSNGNRRSNEAPLRGDCGPAVSRLLGGLIALTAISIVEAVACAFPASA